MSTHCAVAPLESRLLLSAISFQSPAYYRAGTVETPPGTGADLVAVGDMNNDGVADLAMAGNDVTVLPVVQGYVRVLLGKGDGTFGDPSKSVPAGTNLSSVAVGDFNGDGNLDVVVSDDRRDALVHVLLGRGDGTVGPAQSFHSGAQSSDLALADFNEDGKLDVAVANAAPWTPWGTLAPPVNGFALLLGNGDGTLRQEQLMDSGGRPQHFVEAGDLNGDGAADLEFAQVVIGPGDFAAPESLVWAHIAYLDMSTRPAVKVPAAITGMKVADLNGDGMVDVAASAMRDLMSNGAVAATLLGVRGRLGEFGAAKLHDARTAIATDISVADFNADGRLDLALAGDDPRWGRPMPVPALITLENKGGDVFGAADYHPLPGDVTNPGKLATGYFNRDRLPDVGVALPGSNQVGVLLNNSSAVFATSMRQRSLPLSFSARTVARFTVTGEQPAAGALTATINWGDGTQSAGTVVANDDGSFSVLGSHAYRRARVYRTSMVITWSAANAVRYVPGLVRVAGPALA